MHPEVPALKCRLVADVARSSGQVRLRVTGSSMLPCLWPGDILTVRRQPMEELRPGQIVLWYRHGQLWAHRIISHHKHHVVTRGDALFQDDPPLCEHEILGVVVEVERHSQPVALQWQLWQRTLARLLRRCDIATSLLLRLRALRGRLAGEETACAG